MGRPVRQNIDDERKRLESAPTRFYQRKRVHGTCKSLKRECLLCLQVTSDTRLGYMPMLPLDAMQVEEGVYAITDSKTGDKLCAYTTPDGPRRSAVQ